MRCTYAQCASLNEFTCSEHSVYVYVGRNTWKSTLRRDVARINTTCSCNVCAQQIPYSKLRENVAKSRSDFCVARQVTRAVSINMCNIVLKLQRNSAQGCQLHRTCYKLSQQVWCIQRILFCLFAHACLLLPSVLWPRNILDSLSDWTINCVAM